MHRATIYRWPCITRVITFRTVRTCNEENIDSENFTNNFETRWTNTTRADEWIEKFHEFYLLDKRRKNSSLHIRYLKKFQSWRKKNYIQNTNVYFERNRKEIKKIFSQRKEKTKQKYHFSLERERLVFERFRKEWKWHWRYNRIITLYYDIHSPYRGACSPCLNGIFQGRSYQWSNIDKSRDSVPCGARLSSAARTDAYKFPSDVNCRFYVGCELWNRQCGQWTGKGIDRERKKGGSPTLRKFEENYRSKI